MAAVLHRPPAEGQVGGFCVKQRISNSKGIATLERLLPLHGKPIRVLEVLVELNGPLAAHGTDGSTQTLDALGGVPAPLHGAK
jgi:hypothetical protein